MVTKRIIPCLDVKDGAVVKGINFLELRQVGDAVEMGRRYSEEGADELVYLDVSATQEGRRTFVELVGRIAAGINIPFTVGGGISSVEDAARLLDAGADKISVNSAAIARPELISEIASRYGSQFIVCAIDAKFVPCTGDLGEQNAPIYSPEGCTGALGEQNAPIYSPGGCTGDLGEQNAPIYSPGRWMATTHGGKRMTEKGLFSWAREAQERGAGEILFTSMDHDGTKAGYPCDVYARLCDSLRIPVIASGGAGCAEHIAAVLSQGKADAALAASIFHYGEIRIQDLKQTLRAQGIPIRL